jgi:CRP-like cAMP-binding protein
MDDFQQLYANIRQKITISDEELETITPFFKIKKIKKKSQFNQISTVCKEMIFVIKGSIRTYSIDEKGVEHTTQIALENYWIGDLFSLISGEPSEYVIEAIEDSKIITISIFDLDRIYIDTPIMERFFRKLFEKAYITTMKRLNSTLSETAEVRYRKIIETHPDFLNRIPQIYIASYLGITPESLSRIKKIIQIN